MRPASRRVDAVMMQTSKPEEDEFALEACQADLWGELATDAPDASVYTGNRSRGDGYVMQHHMPLQN